MSQAHITRYILRGFTYSVTSACAIFAGYWMQTTSVSRSDILILVIPYLSSLFFFICYANRFHPTESKSAPGDALQTALQREAVIITPIIIVLSIVIIVVYRNPGQNMIAAFIVYCAMFTFYGLFLLGYSVEAKLPEVRHELVWPVVLSIGVSLYYGLSFADLAASLVPLLPLVMLFALYAVSEVLKWQKRTFVIATLISSLVVTVIVILNQAHVLSLAPSVALYLSRTLFCIAVAAYLAVFESWRITANIARRERANPKVFESPKQTGFGTKTSQYSKAVLMALTGSVWILPFYFIFTDYGTLFLVCFVVHAFAFFNFWFYFGRTKYLANRRWPWDWIKTIVGLVFLAILVASPRLFKDLPASHFMPRFTGWQGLSTLIALAGTPSLRLFLAIRRVRKTGKSSMFLRLFENRLNFVRLLSLLCLVSCFIISALLDSFDETSPRYYRAELAYVAYGACILVCLLVEIADLTRLMPQLSGLLKLLGGLLLAIRAFTSGLISLVVFLPLVYAHGTLWRPLSCALPFFLAASGGFAINDFCDVVKDRINKPYRAIPSGKLTPRVTLIAGILMIFGALSIAIYASENTLQFGFYLLAILGVVFYNFFVRYFAFSKAFLTSAVSTLPMLYVVIVLHYPTAYFLIPAATAVFLLGRELLMDIRDMKGDSAAGIITLPMIVGAGATAKIGTAALLTGAFSVLPFVILTYTGRAFFLFGCIFISTLLVTLLWLLRSGRYQRAAIIGLYFPMLCGILLLLR